MKVTWEFEPHEIHAVKDLVAHMIAQGGGATQDRIQRNIEGAPQTPNDEILWAKQIYCLITTQQKSGANSRVTKFISSESAADFPLSLKRCKDETNLHNYTLTVIQQAGMRRKERIASAVVANLHQLEHRNQWHDLHVWVNKLIEIRQEPPHPSQRIVEGQAADYIADTFKEMGNKQARNFWQTLGLTRYNSVIDSRVLKWLRKYVPSREGFITEAGLQNRYYYRFVSEIIFDLCQRAEVLPCLFDGAVFDYFEQ
ncbi:MAG: hypothetical protein U0694_01405 [Anaerolineae bacterium]